MVRLSRTMHQLLLLWFSSALVVVCLAPPPSLALALGPGLVLGKNNNPSPSSPSPPSFWVERVTTTDQCLDVLAFRLWSMQSERRQHEFTATIDGTSSAALESLLVRQQQHQQQQQQLRSNIPLKSTDRYEAGGGSMVQFVAKMTMPTAVDGDTAGETTTDSSSSSSIVVVGAMDAEWQPSARSRTFALPTRVHIVNLRVDQYYRRRGIARALMAWVVKESASLAMDNNTARIKAEAMTLKVEPKTNPNAVRLYERLGFVFMEQVYPGFMIKLND